jgi:riboflavin synthase
MFTGIVEELGSVVGLTQLADAAELRVRSHVVLDAAHGDSISVNGCCLTVTSVDDGVVTFDVMRETLRRTTIGELAHGDPVNLERAATPTTRLGGHIVQGHVDGTSEVLAREDSEHWTTVRLALPADLARYVVSQGSIAVDGVSLTVVDAGLDEFSVSLIPTTLSLTTLGTRAPGQRVNLEVDVMAKHVERLLQLAPTAPAAATPSYEGPTP